MSDDRSVPPAPPAPTIPLDRVVAELARLVTAEPVLAAVWPLGPDGTGRDALDALLRRAADQGRNGSAGPEGTAGPGCTTGPERTMVVAGLGHGTFSVLASHVVDVLDALGVDGEAGADLLAGLAALRRAVVDPTVRGPGDRGRPAGPLGVA